MKNKTLMVIIFLLALGPPARVNAGGTHFIAEHEAGAGFTDSSLLYSTLGLSAGYGGKFKGWPPRFYVLFTYSHGMFDSAHASSVSSATRSVSEDLLLFGPRLYVPVGRNIRLLLQAEMGFAFSNSDWSVNGVENYRVSQTGLATRLAAGIQARLNRWFSVGMMVDRVNSFGLQGDQALARFVGLKGIGKDDGQTRLLGIITFHF